jgi:hypothetical protein
MESTIDLVGNIVGPLVWLVTIGAVGVFAIRGALAERREAALERAHDREGAHEVEPLGRASEDLPIRARSHGSSPAKRGGARMRAPSSRHT